MYRSEKYKPAHEDREQVQSFKYFLRRTRESGTGTNIPETRAQWPENKVWLIIREVRTGVLNSGSDHTHLSWE